MQNKSNQWLSIRASAGSGKTFNLTLRYIYLLFLGARASEILCVTFTNKARDEMQTRITSTLFSLSHGESNNYAKELQSLGISRETQLQKAHEIYNAFITSNNHIMTFDAFFNMIVRKFSFYAGVLSDYEIGANFDLGAQIFEKTLQNLGDSDFQKLADFCANHDINPKKLLDLIWRLKNAEIPLDSSDSIALNLRDFESAAWDEFNTLKDFMLAFLADKKGVENIKKRFLKELETAEQILDAVHLTPKMREKLESLGLDYEAKCQNLKAIFRDYFRAKESEILREITGISRLYERFKLQIIKAHNKLTFEDVSDVCYALLSENFDKNFFYFRLDAKISHILVDEFQDTNYRQYKILLPLIEEIKSGVGRTDVFTRRIPTHKNRRRIAE